MITNHSSLVTESGVTEKQVGGRSLVASPRVAILLVALPLLAFILLALGTQTASASALTGGSAAASMDAHASANVNPSLNVDAEAAAATVYHVDCQNGKDSNNGRSPDSAWRSLNKANKAPLQPGDSLLFKRGCTWQGSLIANWNGTAANPILIGAYGSGNLPAIHNRSQDILNRFHANVRVTGSYQIIEYIRAYIHNAPKDAGCNNQSVGFYVGFYIGDPDNPSGTVSNNVLRYVEAFKNTAGVHLSRGASHNRVEYSSFRGNNVMHLLTPKSQNPWDDIGAWGILLRGDNNEIAYNYFAHNNGWCAYDTAPQGNSIEIYEGRNNNIHHNTAYHDLHFSELGGTPQRRADGNRYAYNLVISPRKDARFIIVRGGGNPYGPTYNTTLYHNTVYFNGSGSQAVVCHSGCSGSILTAVDNIFWAEEKAIFADGAFNERKNIYWNSSGDPFVQFMGFNMNSSSMITNPSFMNPGARQFELRANSPAINAASGVQESVDIDGNQVPQNGAADIGAFEWSSTPVSGNARIMTEDIALAETLEQEASDEGVDDTEAPSDSEPMPDNLPEDDPAVLLEEQVNLPLVFR